MVDIKTTTSPASEKVVIKCPECTETFLREEVEENAIECSCGNLILELKKKEYASKEPFFLTVGYVREKPSFIVTNES